MKRILYGVGAIALAAGTAGGYLWLNPQCGATRFVME